MGLICIDISDKYYIVKHIACLLAEKKIFPELNSMDLNHI